VSIRPALPDVMLSTLNHKYIFDYVRGFSLELQEFTGNIPGEPKDRPIQPGIMDLPWKQKDGSIFREWKTDQGVFAITGTPCFQNMKFIKIFYKTTFFTKETIYKLNVLPPLCG
jgi:hypothetical protein